MNSPQLPNPNVPYHGFNQSTNDGNLDEDTIKEMLCNPIYAGLPPFPKIISDEAWVTAATQLIKNEGPEQFLVNMLHVLRQSMVEYLSTQAQQTIPTPTDSDLTLEIDVYCSHDDFPMILIKGEYVCLAEYTFAHLDNSPIVDLVTEPEVSLVFQNGHTLPLIDPETKKSLIIHDEDYFLNTLSGLSLIDVGWG